MFKKNLYILACALTAILVACGEERQITPEPHQEGNATLLFRVNTPAAVSSSTRGGTVSNPSQYENGITRMTVLLFRSGRLVEALDGSALTSTPATTRFTVTTRAGSEPAKFYLLANTSFTAADLTGRLYGKSPDEVKQQLGGMPATAGTHGIASGFPFWGEYDMPGGLPSSAAGAPTTVTGIKMLRATARAVVTKSVDDATLQITSARIYRMNNGMTPIPAAVDADYKVSAPTIPGGVAPLAPVSCDASSLPLTYYLSESAASASPDASVTGATCLVIGGKFGGSSVDTYYRIDFENREGGSLRIGQILRNHSYGFNIVSVSSPGWSTPDDAANNRSTGLRVEVKDWEEQTSESFQNNLHNFTLSSRNIELGGSQGSASYIDVTTDAPAFTLEWSDTPAPHETVIETADFKVERTQLSAGQYRLAITAKTANNTGSPRTAEFILKAATLSVPVTITQPVPVKLLTENTFMWVASDGKQAVNTVESSHPWQVAQKDAWINTSIAGDRLTVWGNPNHEVQNEYRTGTVKLVNDAGAEAYVTVKQVRWVEWTKAYLKGGNCYRTADNTFVDTYGKRCYLFSAPGTTLQLAATSGDVPPLASQVVGGPAHPNYPMKGDMYSHAQAVQECGRIGTLIGGNWKLPSRDEAMDVYLRQTVTPNKTVIITNPDGSTVYIPWAARAYDASTNASFMLPIELFLPAQPLTPGGQNLQYVGDSFSTAFNWHEGDQVPVRCVRKYN